MLKKIIKLMKLLWGLPRVRTEVLMEERLQGVEGQLWALLSPLETYGNNFRMITQSGFPA